ncbi:MAG: 2-amino-4-hydroxy-6-hydroxymethyldihydropteridine diphosphokinase [Candidatus Latescibacteria bacterium]|nr:2-amino-4-hydroxy-6-hydroxymethyldihydropteridine diphosphokinase [Candidatus Latescibacterota bacterium]
MNEFAFVALGSNLGDRQAYLESGLAALAALAGVEVERTSSVYETAPVGYPDQPFFLNAAAALRTTLSPEELLQGLQEIEARHQRQRQIHWGPRTLDLDLLLHGQRTAATATLQLPHPRMLERCFVLAPLCEIAPDLCHPCTGRPLSAYCRELACQDQLHRAGALRFSA